MAESPPPQQQAEAHRLAQAELVAASVAPLVAAAFSVLDPHDLKDSIPKVKTLIAAIITKYGKMSASLAVRYYQLERRHAGITSPLTITPVKPAGMDQIGPSIDWAMRDLWGPVNTEPITHKGEPLPSFEDRQATAQTNVVGITENLTLDPGRYTVIQAVGHDEEAKGWVRVTEPGCCYFCAMLATRDAVYKSKSSAAANARSRRNMSYLPFVGEGEFKVHDHCRCHVEPVFGIYEPSAQVREWQALWRDNAPGNDGMKGAQLRWRRAFEGRTDPALTKQPALV